ncbi:MAG: SCO0930 family lipoprotein [Acidimicrobiales bacterium]
MNIRTISVAVAAATMVLTAACAGDDDDTATAPPADAAAEGAGDAAAQAIAARSGDSALGEILVGENGLTLYGFTNDTEGTSTCTGTCAEAWPPVLVSPDWSVGPGLDSGIFSTIRREDGSEQLMAGRWPLYYYSGDSAAGDLNGQGSGEVWYAVALDATLIKDAAPAGVGADPAAAVSAQVADSPLGQILVDGEGNTLYGFTNDADGVPTCTADCAGTWPAHLIEGDPALGEGLDPAVFTVVDGAEGGTQLKAGKWPLYRFSGDSAPGDVNGQGSGGVWFVVAADGSLIQDAEGEGSAGGGDGADGDGYLSLPGRRRGCHNGTPVVASGCGSRQMPRRWASSSRW